MADYRLLKAATSRRDIPTGSTLSIIILPQLQSHVNNYFQNQLLKAAPPKTFCQNLLPKTFCENFFTKLLDKTFSMWYTVGLYRWLITHRLKTGLLKAHLKGPRTMDTSSAHDIPDTDEEGTDFTLPEGFTALQVSGQQNWLKKAVGVEFRGILKGRFKRNNRDPKKKDTYFYQIKLTSEGCPAVFDKEEIVLKRGDILCVDESKALEVLESKAEDTTAVWEVFVRYVEKVPNQSDPRTSFWRTAVGARKLEGDQIPF